LNDRSHAVLSVVTVDNADDMRDAEPRRACINATELRIFGEIDQGLQISVFGALERLSDRTTRERAMMRDQRWHRPADPREWPTNGRSRPAREALHRLIANTKEVLEEDRGSSSHRLPLEQRSRVPSAQAPCLPKAPPRLTIRHMFIEQSVERTPAVILERAADGAAGRSSSASVRRGR
jgi:hypothetical protein